MPAMRKDLNTSKGCKMSAAHFRKIAEIIRQMPDHAPTLRHVKLSVTAAFAEGLRGTNPMFKEDRFRAACLEGMDEGSVYGGRAEYEAVTGKDFDTRTKV